MNGTNTCADVDGAGNFVLTGRFSGSIELRISSPQGTAMLTIPDVKRGETIVVVVNLEGTNGGIQILSRNGGHDDDSDDDSSDDTSSDDNSSDDDSSDDTSGSNNQGQSGGSGS